MHRKRSAPVLGQQINDLKEEISHLCEQALQSFSQAELAKRLSEEKIDITLPGARAAISAENIRSHK